MPASLLVHEPSFHLIGTDAVPVFRADIPSCSLFYTPGYLAAVAFDLANDFERDVLDTEPRDLPARKLRAAAQKTSDNWSGLMRRSYEPVCLTLYLNNECNLRCRYCYSCPSPKANTRLDVQAVLHAAELVAANCRRRRMPLTVVFHGGGEPSLDMPFADTLLDGIEQIARDNGLGIFRYIATNGVMSATKARWLGNRFDLIGLSCDGPPDIQDSQRPLWGGGPTSKSVQRTVWILRDMNKPLSIRVTLTWNSFSRQTEIADYLCKQFRPREIHVEPVYEVGRAEDGDTMIDQADAFVKEFLQAEQIALQHGVKWGMSVSRINDLHGPYCHLFRDVLQLVPGNGATTCFKITQTDTAKAHGSFIGEYDSRECFTLKTDDVKNLHSLLQTVPKVCEQCFNRYHCVRTCPEYCPLEPASHKVGFRCQIARQLTISRLLMITDTLLRQPSSTGIWSTQIALNDRGSS